MTMQPQERVERAVIALNNRGIELLQAGYFVEAQVLCKEACALLRFLEEETEPFADGDVKQRLQDTQKKLLTSSPSRTDMPITVLSSDSYLSTLEVNSADAILPIKIGEQADDNGMHILAAIIIYNCGICYICRSRAADGPKLAQRYRLAAAKVLELAVAILQLNDTEPLSTLHVGILTFSTLAQVLNETGRQQAAKECLVRVAKLRHAVAELRPSSSAAAAA